MPKLDLDSLERTTATSYPKPLDQEVKGRSARRLADAGGLTQFGANIVYLAPGAASSMQHWHAEQDEILIVLTGEPTLIEETGEVAMRPGDVATFKAGVENGHCLVNRTEAEASFFVVGTNTATETGTYTGRDVMVRMDAHGFHFTKKDGTPLDGAPQD